MRQESRTIKLLGMVKISPEVARLRAKVAGLSRCTQNGERAVDDPALIEARRDLRAESLYRYVKNAIEEEPALTAQQLKKVRAILV